MQDRCFIEGTVTDRPALSRLLRPLAVAWHYQMVLMEIGTLSPAMLEDVGVLNGDVRGFAWAVASGRLPSRRSHGPEPTTTIGSDVWARAFLLHMR